MQWLLMHTSIHLHEQYIYTLNITRSYILCLQQPRQVFKLIYVRRVTYLRIVLLVGKTFKDHGEFLFIESIDYMNMAELLSADSACANRLTDLHHICT